MIGLFTDYDGTLAPPERAREEGAIPPELEKVLRELSTLIPVAVVTTKDCHFVRRRVPYAAAYACINGLEVHAGGYMAVAEGLRSAELEQLLPLAQGLDALVEAKRTADGRLAGITIDWRGRGGPPEGLEAVIAEAQRLGLKVLRYSRHPFVDIYGANRDKGDAVKILKALLGVRHVAYMGDSENDIPAWREADVRIVVVNSLNRGLAVEGTIYIEYADLPAYLGEVLKNIKGPEK
ncbi:HAD-superfamily hydrolase, subfamily IIB [Pyrobaculum oguniense TE7]|uniref:HAD-superfamily hydrolase, subfamily IIB n=1 Tax=Pyrobaculum oguniense (strain DSM 13380 / JCM 10595 / TE7) TaxID=698757 RepID=H6QCH2_PYROT|nr:HAD-superfamily hydrolase, subfamily IIB [Pyrobaculum oguniense TE7]